MEYAVNKELHKTKFITAIFVNRLLHNQLLYNAINLLFMISFKIVLGEVNQGEVSNLVKSNRQSVNNNIAF